jgi:hypothetical protein
MSSRKKAAKIAPPRGSSQRGPLNRPITVDGAVVLTVSVVEVVGVIEVEASLQLPPVMGVVDENAQLKVTASLKPLRGLMPIEVVPVPPGAEMRIELGLGSTLKSGAPAVTVTVTGEEFEFEVE